MFCRFNFVYLVGLFHYISTSWNQSPMDIPALLFPTVMLVTLLLGRVVTGSLVVHHCIFSWKLFFTIITDYFRLTQILRFGLATGCMDAVTFKSDVSNTLINRFVLNGSPLGYRENKAKAISAKLLELNLKNKLE